MRFTLRKRPTEDARRTVKRFAWIPVPIAPDGGEHYWVWLESYYADQVYQYACDPSCGAAWYGWRTIYRYQEAPERRDLREAKP